MSQQPVFDWGLEVFLLEEEHIEIQNRIKKAENEVYDLNRALLENEIKFQLVNELKRYYPSAF